MTKTIFSKQFLVIYFIGILFSAFSAKIFAHDAGMSSLNVEFAEQTLTIHSDYSLRELEQIAPIDEKQLSDLAKNSVSLLIDGKKIEEDETNFLLNDGHGVVFTQIFHHLKGNQIQIVSSLLTKLKPGHNQFLYIRRADERTIFKEVLTAENDFITIDFAKLEPDTSFGRFLPLGIEHILFGYDHLLFLFALLLTVKNFGEIAKIVTSFTIAHSITLSLATLNIIRVSPGIVEPLIALSIVFVGLENLFRREQSGRWLLVYAFGLIHGFGFASALQEIGVGTGFGVALPLLSFNVGVEIGQIAVVLLLLPVLWKLQKGTFYLSRFVPIGSAVVTLAGIYWLIERILF